jgi:flagellar biosynthesis GTPase FlhF
LSPMKISESRENNTHTTTAGKNEDTSEDDEKKEKQEDDYIGGRSSLFKEADWRRRQEEEVRTAREAQESAIKRMTQVSKAVQRLESKPIHEHCKPTKDMISMEQARMMYNKIYDDCLAEGLPLTKIKDLAANESCIPNKHPETEAIIDTISHAIMRRLMCIIPKTNTGMLEILGPYTKDSDGYGALYAIM